MINSNIDWDSVYHEYYEHGISVIDNFLDNATIASLRQFALDVKYRDTFYEGYSALDLNKSRLLPRHVEHLAEESEKTIKILHNKKFSRGWFFIYDSVSGGVGVHVDPYSDITMNIWVTPDECVEAGKGFNGMDIWKIEPKPEWDYDTSADDPQTCLEYVNKEQAEMVGIEYRFNRAVLFNSKYFHRSQPVRCKEGHDNRKINYALLFNSDG